MGKLLTLFISALLLSCGQGTPAPNNDDSEFQFNTLQSEQSLSSLQHYQMLNQLMAALYKGVPVDAYFQADSLGAMHVRRDAPTLATIRNALTTPSTTFNQQLNAADEIFLRNAEGDVRWDPLESPLAYLYSLDLSQEYFNLWITYQLTNTILFSPGLDLTSVEKADVEAVFGRILEALQQGQTIQELAFNHMRSEQNWRRFRSPEDNVREMMEIFLERFSDEEVPLAAQACQNWYLSDKVRGYRLVQTIHVNTTAVSILDRNDIVTCEDFYQALTEHALFLPNVITRIVRQMFAYQDEAAQTQIINRLIAANPKTFQDLFLSLLFSPEFLYKNSRLKKVEEILLNTSSRISWKPHRFFFDYITRSDANAGANRRNLSQINQETLTYKLGREDKVPVDAVSFSYLQGLVRYSLFGRALSEAQFLEPNQGGWRESYFANLVSDNISNDAYVDWVFVAVIGRRSMAEEKQKMLAAFAERNINARRQSQARLMFDYLTRLPEFYYFVGVGDTL